MPHPKHSVSDSSTSSSSEDARNSLSLEVDLPAGGAAAAAPKAKFPTRQKYEKSIVQVYTNFHTFDYDNPWRAPEESSCSGSGVIISHEGRNYILTNAHVVENSITLEIRLANDRRKKYEAKRICVSYQSDLALLEVDDPEFDLIVEPADLGEMVSLEQKVMTAGFPMGGQELSVSKGVVSRIEVDTYSMSGEHMLQVQLDAAINPGNSGGPVFSAKKVVGLAFQGYDGADRLGYMIPIPIIRHFLQEVFSGRPYRGFPIIPYYVEQLENAGEREYYRLGSKSGVRVTSIDKLSDAHYKLQVDDVILTIDGMTISNEGTIDINGIGNCIDFVHATHSKFIGDSVRLQVLRKNKATDRSEILNIDVELDCVPGDTTVVANEEHDKMPTYYFNSAVCFVPLTRNYMEGDGCEFSQLESIEHGCLLSEVPKTSPDKQIIIVSHILESKATRGYRKHLNSIVKEINGIPIDNMRDVIEALEGNPGAEHVINLAPKSRIILPNMSAAELKKLLDRSRIHSDRSEDLKSRPMVSLGAAAANAGIGYGADASSGAGGGSRSRVGHGAGAGAGIGSRGHARARSGYAEESDVEESALAAAGSGYSNRAKARAGAGYAAGYASEEEAGACAGSNSGRAARIGSAYASGAGYRASAGASARYRGAADHGAGAEDLAEAAMPCQATAEFTSAHFKQLSENEHGRFAPNSKKIGHALVATVGSTTVARQYALPDVGGEGAPQVRPLLQVKELKPFPGMRRYSAITPGGTAMYSKRMVMGHIGTVGMEDAAQAFELACFSPNPGSSQPFWGSIKPTPLFSATLSKAVKSDLKKELKDIEPVTKGGFVLDVEHASVPQRDAQKKRTPSQNEVMGESARDAYEGFFDKLSDELHPEMKARLKRSFMANIKDGIFKNNYRPEWMHLYGWSLMPFDRNAQTKENMAAGPKWANTQMMVLERTVKWFALNSPESLLSIMPRFEMLLDSDLIKELDFEVKVQVKDRYVKLMQHIDPFLAYPIFTKASDIAQSTAITHSLLMGVEPSSEHVVAINRQSERQASAGRASTSVSVGRSSAGASGSAARSSVGASASAPAPVSAWADIRSAAAGRPFAGAGAAASSSVGASASAPPSASAAARPAAAIPAWAAPRAASASAAAAVAAPADAGSSASAGAGVGSKRRRGEEEKPPKKPSEKRARTQVVESSSDEEDDAPEEGIIHRPATGGSASQRPRMSATPGAMGYLKFLDDLETRVREAPSEDEDDEDFDDEDSEDLTDSEESSSDNDAEEAEESNVDEKEEEAEASAEIEEQMRKSLTARAAKSSHSSPGAHRFFSPPKPERDDKDPALGFGLKR